MQFYPFDVLQIKPTGHIVWLKIEPIPQGCGIDVSLGDAHARYPAFKAVEIVPPSDCMGGEVRWEAPFVAAPPEVLRLLPITPLSPVCEQCGANGCPTRKEWALCAACRGKE